MFDKLLTQFAEHIHAPRGHPLENPAGFAGGVRRAPRVARCRKGRTQNASAFDESA